MRFLEVHWPRARLISAFVMWRTDGGARVRHVDGFDGARAKVVDFDIIDADMHIVGADGIFDGSPVQPGVDPKLVPQNTFPPVRDEKQDDPQIYYGLSLSVLVKLGPLNDDSTIRFTSAGADFRVPM